MSEPMKYRKKPVVIEAIQYTGANINDIARFVGDVPNWSPDSDSYDIETLEGTMTAEHGDWIIKGVKGEFYPCKPDIFEQTYTTVSEYDPNAALNRSIETLVNAVCAATGDDPADEDYSGMMLRLGQLGERAKDAAPSSIQPGDLVENIERPDLDYRRVIGVGEEWIFLDFQLSELEAGELPTPLPKANYKKVQS